MRYGVMMVAALVAVGLVAAQDDEVSIAGDWEYQPGSLSESTCFGSTTTSDLTEAENTETRVTFAVFDEGETVIEVSNGPDIVYTNNGDDSYSGALLIPIEDYGYESTLTVNGVDEVQSVSASESACTLNTTILYGRVEDGETELWTEGERTFSDISFFGPCLGRSDAQPGSAWTRPDVLVPIRFGEDTLAIGRFEFEGTEGVFVHSETIAESGMSTVTTRTLTVDREAEMIEVHVEFQLNERDDCMVVYDSSYTPFDGDLEALQERIDAIVEAETEE